MKYVIERDTLVAIGDAIREKTGGFDPLSPAEMVTAIAGISGEGGTVIVGGGGEMQFVSKKYTTESDYYYRTYDFSDVYKSKGTFYLTYTKDTIGDDYLTQIDDGVVTSTWIKSYGAWTTYTGMSLPTITIDNGLITIGWSGYKPHSSASMYWVEGGSGGSTDSGGGITPEGELAITENGNYDVTEYAAAAVNVPVGVFPEGTLEITENGEHTVTTYDKVNVNVASSSGGGDPREELNIFLRGNVTEYIDDTITEFGAGAFAYMNMYSIQAPNVTRTGYNVAYNATNLHIIDITNCETLGHYSFGMCPNLYQVTAPNLIDIGQYCFQNLSNYNHTIESLVFEKVETVQANAFRMANVKKFDFHKVLSIETYCFGFCNYLETFIIRTGAVCQLGASGFRNSTIANGTGYIYVPKALVESYKSAANWSTYANQIRAIEDYPEICG